MLVLDPSKLSPAPPSLGLALAALLTAAAGLVGVAIIGNAVRAGVTDPGLHSLATVALYVALAAGAITLWLGAQSLAMSLKSRAETSRADILGARASAAKARDSGMIVFGLTLALMIGFFLIQMILFNDGKIRKTFLRWDLMTESAADVARAFLVNLKLALIAQALVMIVGLFLAVARLTPGKAGAPVRMLAIAYIDLFRAIPAIIVLYLIGFGLPLTGLPLISKVSSQWFAIIVRDLAQDGMTMFLATHEMQFAREVSDMVVFLEQGKLLEKGPPEQIFGDPKEPRTRQFLKQTIEAGRM